MNEILQKREAISSLVDGQLVAAEFAHSVDFVRDYDALLSTWQSYHLIGEVLRSETISAQGLDHRLIENFRQQMALNSSADSASIAAVKTENEVASTPATAAPSLVQYEDVMVAVAAKSEDETAANHAIFRWKVATGIASVMAVGSLIFNLAVPQQEAIELAQAPSQILPQIASASNQWVADAPNSSLNSISIEEPVVVLRDPNLDELLNAHQQFGASSALQMSSGFLRNATFEGASR